MKEIDEEEVLAKLYLNLKGSKKKSDDWITIARNCKKLTDYYGSAKKVADKLGVHYEIIRSILKLLTLPKEVQQLVRNNLILYDVGQRIARINGAETQIRVARAIVGLSNHDAREVIQYAIKYPDDSLEEFRVRVISSKNKTKNISLLIVPLEAETYELLRKLSEEEKLSPEKLILKIVNDWIKEHGVHR
jgi:hypothetical protein